VSGLVGRLREGPPLLFDGGLGSMLIARGLPAGAAPETWVLERPAEVARAHRAYVEAGSEAVHTSTFGGNRTRLAHFGLADRVDEISRAAVRLARESGARFVLGDVGPSGTYLPPVGAADPADWRAAFREQAAALASAGVDALHVETMSDLREALAALSAAREAAPGVTVLVSMTFERRKRGFFTVMGDPLVASLRALADAGADAVGANCTLASADMRALAIDAAAVGHPLVLQPNAGAPEIAAGGIRYAQDPEQYAEDAAAFFASGAAAVGGCCGTDPRFVAALCRRRAPSS
jgi:methionine synthase I (cobalamin-dependent)